MAKDITVHTGVAYKGTPKERKSAWVETTVPLQLEAHELADGLGSKFLRYLTDDEKGAPGERPDVLPDSLTQREILKWYREEFSYWGANLSTWGDDMSFENRASDARWLLEIVLDAFPAMRGYEVR